MRMNGKKQRLAEEARRVEQERLEKERLEKERIEREKKEGKKKMREIGSVEVPQSAFLAVLRTEDDAQEELQWMVLSSSA